MPVITADKRFAEARVYAYYVLAVFRPGLEVPTFGQPRDFTDNLNGLTDDDHKVLIEEGRRQLDRQLADLERNKSRAATMLTIGLAEVAVLAAGANRAFAFGLWTSIIWIMSAILALLALGGAVSLLTSQAIFGRVDARAVASGPIPLQQQVAIGYAQSVSWGEETIRTRITILRDGVLLAVASAMLYALIWPFISSTPSQQSNPQPKTTGVLTTCPTTCTPSSPGSLPTRTSPNSGPAPSPTSAVPVPAPSIQRP
ncbi:hypothetical protein D0T12_32735 [Actinomadura spongiicola]|uniref:Uncharacterized protein n=1 Tax=Actinomadura spongiicola TaxID=2303421 RepID=A0A372G7L5_9ACTN|nr:hypothetical protein [Actinomadura spongiicola]RFS81394.1 hypothetical protein D0T12_32735 [Actinomadura spongiicola]